MESAVKDDQPLCSHKEVRASSAASPTRSFVCVEVYRASAKQRPGILKSQSRYSFAVNGPNIARGSSEGR